MISNAQSGRLEDQRCFLPPSRSTPATPTHNGMALNNNTGQPGIVCSWTFCCSDTVEITFGGPQQVQMLTHSSRKFLPPRHDG